MFCRQCICVVWQPMQWVEYSSSPRLGSRLVCAPASAARTDAKKNTVHIDRRNMLPPVGMAIEHCIFSRTGAAGTLTVTRNPPWRASATGSIVWRLDRAQLPRIPAQSDGPQARGDAILCLYRGPSQARRADGTGAPPLRASATGRLLPPRRSNAASATQGGPMGCVAHSPQRCARRRGRECRCAKYLPAQDKRSTAVSRIIGACHRLAGNYRSQVTTCTTRNTDAPVADPRAPSPV